MDIPERVDPQQKSAVVISSIKNICQEAPRLVKMTGRDEFYEFNICYYNTFIYNDDYI